VKGNAERIRNDEISWSPDASYKYYSNVFFFQIVEWELELLRKKRDEFNALVAGKAKNI